MHVLTRTRHQNASINQILSPHRSLWVYSVNMNEDGYINKSKASWFLKVILNNLELIIQIQLLHLFEGPTLLEFWLNWQHKWRRYSNLTFICQIFLLKLLSKRGNLCSSTQSFVVQGSKGMLYKFMVVSFHPWTLLVIYILVNWCVSYRHKQEIFRELFLIQLSYLLEFKYL